MITTNDRAMKLEEISDEHIKAVAEIMGVTDVEFDEYRSGFIGVLLSEETALSIKATDFLRQFYDIPNEYQQQVDWDEVEQLITGYLHDTDNERAEAWAYRIAEAIKQNFHLIKKNNETTTG